MARKDSLLRLHQRLIAKRDSLRQKLFHDLRLTQSEGGSAADIGDAASDGAQNELQSQLAALESRELRQIERAIESIRDGRYGHCEACDEQIPIARLNALPFTQLCVECQRIQEETGGTGEEFDADWENAYDFEGRMSDKELTLGDLDIDG